MLGKIGDVVKLGVEKGLQGDGAGVWADLVAVGVEPGGGVFLVGVVGVKKDVVVVEVADDDVLLM